MAEDRISMKNSFIATLPYVTVGIPSQS
ncbi:uncharacterized protein G2W53_006641 [Senna tora]|uniref:Uncharacterized protein n=1 Tax=Senna tora TaxID=362788 RepID=A0A834X5F6_9FABA|nr:uncharacterized protein G2W53_006641 [Senna tora]